MGEIAMLLRVAMIAIAAAGFCLALTALFSGGIGRSDRVFDRTFLADARTATGLAEIEWLARARGYPIATQRADGHSVSRYHWEGARHSFLAADAVGPRLVHLEIRTPAGEALAVDFPWAARLRRS
jgi:hypothetical protein